MEIEAYSDYYCDKSIISTRKDQTYSVLGFDDMLKEAKDWVDSKKLYEY